GIVESASRVGHVGLSALAAIPHTELSSEGDPRGGKTAHMRGSLIATRRSAAAYRELHRRHQLHLKEVTVRRTRDAGTTGRPWLTASILPAATDVHVCLRAAWLSARVVGN